MGAFENNYTVVGAVGCVINISMITCVAWQLMKIHRCARDPTLTKRANFQKIYLSHVLLFFGNACDLPQNITFLLTGDYTVYGYAFHSLRENFLYGALSFTLRDWAVVIQDLNKLSNTPVFLRSAVLITINAIYGCLSCYGFLYLLITNDLDEYVKSPVYAIKYLAQFVIGLVLSSFMAQGGMRLKWRIDAVVGRAVGSGIRSPSPERKSYGKRNDDVVVSTIQLKLKESMGTFQEMLRRLIYVMIVIILCLIFESIFLILNYTLANADDENSSFCPYIMYWFFEAWLPFVGPTLALIALMRAQSRYKTHIYGADPSSGDDADGDTLSSTPYQLGFDEQGSALRSQNLSTRSGSHAYSKSSEGDESGFSFFNVGLFKSSLGWRGFPWNKNSTEHDSSNAPYDEQWSHPDFDAHADSLFGESTTDPLTGDDSEMSSSAP